MARRSPKQIDTKQRVLDAALALFGERGFYEVTVDDIAARAGLTKGAVYYYFTDKNDIGRDLEHELDERLKAEAVQAFDSNQDTATNLKRCFAAYLAAVQRVPEARLFIRDCWAIPELNAAGDRDRFGSVAQIRAVLERGIEQGDIVALDPDALAHVLAGAYADATFHILTTGEADATLAVVDRLVDSLAVREERPASELARRETSRSSRGRHIARGR